MLMRRTSRRGFGQTTPAPSFLDTVLGIGSDCSNYATWLFNAGCWSYSPTEWTTEEMYGGVLPTPAGAPQGTANALIVDPSTGQLTAAAQADPLAAINAAISSQVTADQAAALLAVQTEAPSSSACSATFFNGVCDYWVYGGVGLLILAIVLIAGGRK